MIKSILVPATGNDTDTDAFAAALMVARSFAAHIDALHVRLDPIELAVATAASDGSGAGGPMLESLIDQLEQDADEREAKTRAGFSEFCTREAVLLAAAPAEAGGKPSAQFHVETGQEARWMAAYGMTADLVVAARGTPGKDAVARSTLEALLLESGRPLLIPGASMRGSGAVERVAIAWKPTPQAVRAVAFAMPFLAHAKEITVLTVEEEEGRRDEADRLVNYLAWHGVKAIAERLTPGRYSAAERLLVDACARADLLVMGGYGHTRLREWVFGGFTQLALVDAPLAVLIAH
jgi:nucleotide-binding universal stress UspA family protein